MQADLGKCVRELANFLQVQISDEKVQELCKFVHFDNMKANPANLYPNGDLGVFRQGKTGKWKEVFNKEQSEEMDRIYSSKIEELALPVKYWLLTIFK